MIAAIVDDGFEIDHRVAGEVTADGRLDNALLDGRDEVAGDGAAKDFAGKLEAAAAGERLHADFAVAELAVAAALLFVASVSLGLAADGFAIGDLGRFQRDFGVVALLEPRNDGFDMRLAGAGDEELIGLRIAEEADKQVLFHELVDGGGQLVFVGARLGLDGVGHGRLGRLWQFHLDVGALLRRGCRR